MFGSYQCSELRIEVAATQGKIQASLIQPEQLKQWLWPQQVSLVSTGDAQLSAGQQFDSALGLFKMHHEVETLQESGIRFLLSGSVDGFHEWQWGEGWVQSRLEGVSLLPLHLGQTLSLIRLKRHLQNRTVASQ
ncbi:MAG: hypothetical protein AAGJ95_14970 [Cyanobacteria bacterium J06554_11]